MNKKEDADFLDKVADAWTRANGDDPHSESIWALKLRAIAKYLREEAKGQ